MPEIILASASPRRKQLLEWADVSFTVMVADTAEDYPAGLTHEEVAVHIASHKAHAVQERLEQDRKAVIIAADTIVVLEDKIIGKPQNREEAIAFLTALGGRKHLVISGVCLVAGDKCVHFAETTGVTFHPLSLAQITYYVDCYRPYDKAGAYAIQEWIGVTAVKSINGDFYNVMGLPVSRVLRELNSIHPAILAGSGKF